MRIFAKIMAIVCQVLFLLALIIKPENEIRYLIVFGVYLIVFRQIAHELKVSNE